MTYRVLIVATHLLTGRTLRGALAGSSRIRVVADTLPGATAVDLCARHQPDVLLVDAEGNARDVLAGLPELLGASPGTRAIVVSTDDDDGVVAAAIAAGADGFLSRDASVEDLVSAIVAVAEGRSVLSGHRLGELVRRLSTPVEAAAPLPGAGAALTPREAEVLRRIARGQSTRLMARELDISVNTARTHIQNVLTKLGVHSKLEAAAYASQHGLLAADAPARARPIEQSGATR